MDVHKPAVRSCNMKIKLEFTPHRGKYVKTKPLHHSQTIVTDNKRKLIIEIKVIPNLELIAKILEFGSDVIVINPQSLREKLIENLEKSLENYK